MKAMLMLMIATAMPMLMIGTAMCTNADADDYDGGVLTLSIQGGYYYY